jgi:quinol monooxygenase YgiN
MIVVSGVLTFDPAKSEQLVGAIEQLVTATRAEDGNVDYEFTQCLNQPGKFRVFEEWASQEVMDAHLATPHFLEFMGAAGDLGLTGADLHRYDATNKSSLF